MSGYLSAFLGRGLRVLALVTLVFGLSSVAPVAALPDDALAGVIFVDIDATGIPDGLSWATAFTDLPSALLAATPGTEIWVAEGTYLPTGSLDRTATIRLKSAVAVFGGFAGTESTRNARDWFAHPTILSGDIGTVGDTGDNSYHVITAENVDTSAMLDGFIIRDGRADGVYNTSGSRGGGMICTSAQPTLRNLIFTANYAQGAALYAGAALYNSLCTPTLISVAFISNEARLSGGAVLNEGSSPTFINALFYDNAVLTPANGGTAVVNLASATPPTFINVTIAGNVGSSMGTLTSSAMINDAVNPVIRNSVIWGNIPANLPFSNSNGAVPVLTYTIIEGGYAGTGNLNVDPRFRSLETGDVRLSAGSPAIDSAFDDSLPFDTTDLDNDGNTAERIPLDLDGYTRINGDHLDRGAYEALPDVAVTKSVYPAAVRAGDYVTYTLTFQNTGALAATGVVLTDLLDDDLVQRSWSSTGVTVTRQANTFYVWDVEGSVAPGQGTTILVFAQVSPSASGTYAIPNVFSGSTPMDEVDYTNNSVSTPLIVDNDAPLPPTLSTPANGAFINDNTPLLTWAASPSADTVAYSVDVAGTLYRTGNVTSFTSPALADGTYTWSVAAIDRVEFFSTYPTPYSFTLDTIPPDTVITSAAPLSPTNQITATFTFTGTDVGVGLTGFQCKLDTAAWAACTSPHTTPVLADGIHNFYVRAVDGATNVDLSPATASWRVDATGPIAPLLLSPATGTLTSTTQLNLAWSSVSDAASYAYAVNGVASNVGLVTQAQTAILAEGVYTWTVWAYDALGNLGASAAPFTFTIDTTPPAVPVLISPPNNAGLLGLYQQLTWQAVPGAAGYMLKLDGIVTDVGNVTTIVTPPLTSPMHTWTVAAYDVARNLSAYATLWHFEIGVTNIYLPIAVRNIN